MKFKHYAAFALVAGLFMIVGSCQKHSDTPLATTPLYDTLGWFIQGGMGPVEGNGIKMINDPENPGQQIQAGRLAIRTVVNTALPIIAADPQLSPYFPVLLAELGAGNTTGYAHLLETFTDFVQQGVSGQEVYHGLSMLAAHNNATYNRFGSPDNPTADSSDFDKFVGDVADAAASLTVPESIIAQLGALLYTTEGDVVQR